MAKGKNSIKLQSVPPDVRKIILKKQGDMKVNCNCIISQESAVYAIIRESAKQ